VAPPWLERTVEKLLDLTGRQWTAILVVLACLNLFLYGMAAGLYYAYVILPPAQPTIPLLGTSIPTLRPTYTPTWTSTPVPGARRTPVQTTPFPVATSTPVLTPTTAP
jgi:hypothetical protein